MFNQFTQMPQYQPQPLKPSMESNLIRVTGIEGAKAYQMPYPNSTIALFDAGEDLMYIKTTDEAGFPTIRTFKFEAINNGSSPMGGESVVSRAELEELRREIEDVKQLIQQPGSKSAGTGNKPSKAGNE